MKSQLYVLSEVCQRLGVKPHRITYLLMTRRLPEPRLRLGNRRVFTDGDIRKISIALGLERKEVNP